ncbi:hypothetical protein [Streptomyces sp. NRRL B-1381]|uniref:hypothetical protein n=1 Tax=Streptomyces sp. NRRL B-1381 TaxID=1463829 RepID=UPI0004C14982|nr:hypothetical protein [Streptomyces sp. NRRL B-1381]
MTDRPGQWPVPNPADVDDADEQGERHLALVKARAAFAVPMDSIRAHLEEQPSVLAVRRAERQWKAQIGAAADQAVERLKRTG